MYPMEHALDCLRHTHTALLAAADEWLTEADALDAQSDAHDETVIDHEGELADAVRGQEVYRLRKCAAEVLDALGIIDTESSRSRQHYIDTGRYLTWTEVEEMEDSEYAAEERARRIPELERAHSSEMHDARRSGASSRFLADLEERQDAEMTALRAELGLEALT